MPESRLQATDDPPTADALAPPRPDAKAGPDQAQPDAPSTAALLGLLEDWAVGVARFDEHLRCRYANAAFARELAMLPADVLGLRATDLPAAWNHPDYRRLLLRALRQRDAGELTQARRLGDGRTRHLHIQVMAELRDGGVLVVVTDVSALTLAGHKLEQAERVAHLGFWEYDFRSNRSAMSDGACRLAGREPGWHPTRKELLDLHHPDERAHVTQLYEDCIRAQRSSLSYSYRMIGTDHPGRHIHCQVEFAYAPDGQPLTLFAVSQDITDQIFASNELLKREEEFRVLVENTPDTVARYDMSCRRTYVNPALMRLMGQPREALIGHLPTEFANTPQTRAYEARLQDALATGRDSSFEYTLLAAGGQRVVSELRISPERDTAGNVVSVLAVGRDITALKDTETRLEDAQRVARICQWEWDYTTHRSRISALGREMLGLADDAELNAEQFALLMPQEQRNAVQELYREAFARQQTEIRYEHSIQHPDGQHFELHTWARLDYGPEGRVLRATGVTQDVTSLKRLQRQTHQLAFYDPLTQLPNRSLLKDRLQQALAEAHRHGHNVGVVLMDIDHFQKVNDSLDYKAGDTLLKIVAERLAQALRDCDTVARMGGDEFAIIVSQIRSPADLAAVAQRLRTVFEAPIALPDTEIVVTASAGIAVYPADGSDSDELLAHADAAMYHAKHLGRDNFQFYARELTASALERLRLESDLRKGVERGELELFYQPKIALGSGELIGAEALLRWRHPERGLVPPDRFIGIAEDTGLIIDIGRWALRTACADAVAWNAGRAQPLTIAVNLSPRQFYSGDLLGAVRAALRDSECNPAWMELEITESLLLNDRADIRAMLGQLHEIGVSIAIDDFGTGYSALSYLTRFPVDTIKIDRSFIRDLTTNADSAALVKAIVTLSRSLRKQIVAEGVETDEQRDHLHAWGCQMAQGYFYGKPIPCPEFTALLGSWVCREARPLATAGA